MRRNLLRRANFAIFAAIALAIVTVQSTIFGYFPLNFAQPDAMLILSVYLGFRREPIEGGLLVILGSAVMEAHSGSGPHFLLTTYLYAFVIAEILSRAVVVPGRLSSIGIVAALALLKRAGILVLLAMRGHGENGVRHFLVFLLPGLLVQALLTPLLFGWFTRIDLATFKDEHAEDEYDINKGF